MTAPRAGRALVLCAWRRWRWPAAARPAPGARIGGATPTPCSAPSVRLRERLGRHPVGLRASSATSSATVSPATPASTPIAGFAAASVTFVSSDDGWALGTVGGALALARTQDGGSTWTSVTPPPTHFSGQGVEASSGVSGIRFANTEDGWVYGPELWATQDGGSTWTEISLPGVAAGSPVWSLETSGGIVAAAVQATGTASLDIETSPVGSSAWSLSPASVEVGAGPIPEPSARAPGLGRLAARERPDGGGRRPPAERELELVDARLQHRRAVPRRSPPPAPRTSWPSATSGRTAEPAPRRTPSSRPTGVPASPSWRPSFPPAVRAARPWPAPAPRSRPPGAARRSWRPSTEVGAGRTVYSGATGTSIAYVGFTTTTQGVAIATATGSASGTLLMTRERR